MTRILYVPLIWFALVGASPGQENGDRLAGSLAGQPPFRRLFLDTMVVERSQGLERVFHAAVKHIGNPIIRRDRPWEGWGPYLYGTVLRHDGKLKMWYQVIGKESADVCYAESQDGLEWLKPRLGIVEYNGSKANNIVAATDHCHIPSVIQVRQPTSPSQTMGALRESGRTASRLFCGGA